MFVRLSWPVIIPVLSVLFPMFVCLCHFLPELMRAYMNVSYGFFGGLGMLCAVGVGEGVSSA